MLGSTTKQNEIEKATKEQDEKYKNLQATIEKESAKTAEESAISPIWPGQINAEKKDWRDAEIDKTEDNKKFLENKTSDTKTAIEDAKESISTSTLKLRRSSGKNLAGNSRALRGLRAQCKRAK